MSHQTSRRAFWAYFGILLVLSLAELPFARAAGFAAFVFLTMLSVGYLGRRSVPLVAAFSVAALVVPVVIPSWHGSLGASFDDITPLAIPVVAITTFAVLQVLRSNQALAEARAELARLAAENERMRIAGPGRSAQRRVRLPRCHPGWRASPRPGTAAGVGRHSRPAHGHRHR